MNIKKMDDICEFINGGAWSDKEYVNSGLPVLKVSNCKNSGFQVEDINYLPVSSDCQQEMLLLQQWGHILIL